MSHAGLLFFWPEDFDIHAITKENVRIAAWLKLPFRFRTGSLFHMVMDAEAGIDIWIYNRFPIPEGEPFEVTHKRRYEAGYKTESDYSEAIIIFNHPEVEKILQKKINKEDEFEPPAVKFPLFPILQTLNEFTCAYATATNELFGGSPLKLLSNAEFFNSLYAEITLLCPTDYNIQEQEIAEILEWIPEREFKIHSTSTGQVSDLPEEKLQISFALEKIRDHAFYELAFKAKTEMVAGDPIVALVLACAAMEGAHAALLRQAMRKALGEDNEELVTKLLREQGIYTLVQLTSRIFLPVEKQPTIQTITNCTKALEARNAIMHAKSKKGVYAFRKINVSELNAHYSALLVMYDIFMSALD